MNPIIRFYNTNRKTIFKVLIVIIFIFALIKLLDSIAYNTNKQKENNNVAVVQNEKYMTTNTISKFENMSAISGTIQNSNTQSQSTIEQFVKYCNTNDIQKAYDMLTKECKEEMYQNIEIFKETYLKNNFNAQKTISIQNWTGSTYVVSLTEDVMSTGKSTSENTLQDYITIVYQDGSYKVNINNYIGRTSINKIQNFSNLSINVMEKNIYLDYETYKIGFKNTSQNTILLDTMENVKSVYIQDSNGTKYTSFTNEFLKENLIVSEGGTNIFKIKFSNGLKLDRQMSKIIFSNVIFDYEEYKSTQDKSQYKKQTISIEV